MYPLHSLTHAPPIEPSQGDLSRVAVLAHTKKFSIANSRMGEADAHGRAAAPRVIASAECREVIANEVSSECHQLSIGD